MSASPPEPSSPRKPWLRLSRRALLLIALAFGAGLLLFLLLIAGKHDDDAFFHAGSAPATSTQEQAFEPLPTPDATGGNTGMAGEPEDDATPSPQPEESAGVMEDDFPTPDAPPVYEPIAPPPAVPATTNASARPVRNPQPRYPPDALRRGETGTVLLQVQVDAQGHPTDLQVVQSSRSRSLDREAVRAVQEWEFSPAIRNGQPVPARVLIPIDFNR